MQKLRVFILKHRNSVFLTVFILLSVILPLTGCGGGADVGSAGTKTASKTAALNIKFNSPDYDKIILQCKNYSLTFYDQDKTEVCQRTLQRRSFNGEGVAEIKNLPLSAAVMLGVITDNNNAPLALIEPHEFSLTAGQTAETQIDAILTGADALSEYLTGLRLTSKKSSVTLAEGRKMHVSAKGVFSFEGYEGVECNLSQAKSLTWKSSDENIVKTCGKGFFQAIKAGEAEVSAVMGGHEKSLKVTVQTKADGTDSEDAEEPYILEPDPESVEEAEDPNPDNPALDKAAYLQLNLKALPAGSTYMLRGYDNKNQSRFIKNEQTNLNPSFEVDTSVTQIGGLVKSANGEIIGLFNEEVALTNGKILEVTPEILSGEALAARGHLNITTDQEAYDFNTYEVYRKGFVSVSCKGEFGYSVIPGAWEYKVVGDFLENLASFDDEELDADDSSVFRFFGPGTHTVNVTYKGVSASFTVIVVGPDEPVEIVFFKPDASLGSMSNYKNFELQGYANGSSEPTFTKSFTPSDLNSEGKLSLSDQSVTTDTKNMSLFAVSNDKKISLSEYKQLLVPGKTNLVSKAYETKSDEVLRQSLEALWDKGAIWGHVGEEVAIPIFGRFKVDGNVYKSINITSLVEWQNDYEDYIQCVDPVHGKFKIIKEYRGTSASDFQVKIYASFANMQLEKGLACWSADNVDLYALDVDITDIAHPTNFAVLIAVEDLEHQELLMTSSAHVTHGGSYFTEDRFMYSVAVRKKYESTHCRIYAYIFDRELHYLCEVIENDVLFEKGKTIKLDCSPSKIQSAARFMKLTRGSFTDDAFNDVTGKLGYTGDWPNGTSLGSNNLVDNFTIWYFVPLSSGEQHWIWMLDGMFTPGYQIRKLYPERVRTEFSNPSMFSFYDDRCFFEAPGESKVKYVYTTPDGVSVESQEFTVRVAELSHTNTVEVNFDASTVPVGASTVSYEFLSYGWFDTDTLLKDYSLRNTFNNIADIATSVFSFVYNANNKIVGLASSYFPRENGNYSFVLNDLKIASGTAMAEYLDYDSEAEEGPPFIIEQTNFTADIGESFQASAQLRLSPPKIGCIYTYDNLTREVEWSCADDGIELGGAPGSFIARKAGEHKIRAHFAGVTAEATVKVSGSGCYYGSADLENKRGVSVVTYTPDSMVSGSAQATVTGGQKAAYSISRDEVVKNMGGAGADRKQMRCGPRSGNRFKQFVEKDKLIRFNKKSLKSSASSASAFDYVNAELGSVIHNLKGLDINDNFYSFDAKNILANNSDNFSKYNGTRSNDIIVFSEIVNGKPVIDLNDDNYVVVYLLDQIMGKYNPYDRDGMPILDRLHATWGHEYGYGVSGANKGGLDGTEKLIIVLRDGDKLEDKNSVIGGYFCYADVNRRIDNDISNEGEILYLNASTLINDLAESCAIAAHELQHSINANMHYFHDGKFDGDYSEDTLDEGCACLSSLLCGFGLDDTTFSEIAYNPYTDIRRANMFFANAKLYCIKDHDANLEVDTDFAYGGNYAFISYFYDRFGVSALQNYLKNNRKALSLADDYEVLAYAASQTGGQNLSFAQIFADFGKACLLSGSDVSGNIPAKYRMTTIAPGSEHTLNNRSVVISNITPRPLELGSSKNLTMLPWTNNYYITPSLTYGANEEHRSLLCFNLGALKNIFKMMLFDNSFKYEGDLN